LMLFTNYDTNGKGDEKHTCWEVIVSYFKTIRFFDIVDIKIHTPDASIPSRLNVVITI